MLNSWVNIILLAICTLIKMKLTETLNQYPGTDLEYHSYLTQCSLLIQINFLFQSPRPGDLLKPVDGWSCQHLLWSEGEDMFKSSAEATGIL